MMYQPLLLLEMAATPPTLAAIYSTKARSHFLGAFRSSLILEFLPSEEVLYRPIRYGH